MNKQRLVTQRMQALLASGGCVFFFLCIFAGAWIFWGSGESTNILLRKLPPHWAHPFGTDWLGRDMLARTVQGLCVSLGIGFGAALCSSVIALIFGLMAATLGRRVDMGITWLVDVCIATPHLVLLLLISFACGGGAKGVIVAVAASHWPNLTRIIRAEVLQLQSSGYVKLSRKLGKSSWFIASEHMLPHIVPQFLVGLILLFPHAILHAAALTFLGFGMSPHTPAIGVLLAESMRYLSMGLWWLAVAPGVALFLAVKAFDILGENIRVLTNPRTCRQ